MIEQPKERSPEEFVLLPYQQKWCADQSTVKIAEKSRRIGLTWAESADSALMAASESGMDIWYIGYNKEMALEFIQETGSWSKHYQMACAEMEEEIFIDTDNNGETKEILTYKIRYASGYKVTALSSRPSNLRGKQGKVIIDEAAFHDDLAGLLKAAMALTMWGGKVSIISTHFGVDNPFNELIEEVRKGRKDYSIHHITLTDAITQGLYKRICLKMKIEYTQEGEQKWEIKLRNHYGDDAAEELDCIPSQSGGAWLSWSLIESCMADDIPVISWEQNDEFSQLLQATRESAAKEFYNNNLKPVISKLNPDFRSHYGLDFARNGDLSDLWVLQVDKFLKKRTSFVLEMRNIPFEQQRQILFMVVDNIPNFAGGKMDAGGNGAYLAEVAMQRYGLEMVEEVKFSTEWYRENMPKYKAALEDKEFIMPLHDDIRSDHRIIEVVDGIARIPKTRTKGKDGKQRHGDSAIAAVLAFIASNKPVYPFVFDSSGSNRIATRMGDYV